MSQLSSDESDAQSRVRAFALLTVPAALLAWDIGFELTAFETISYRRVFGVFVISTVVLVATIVHDDESFATSGISRGILGLPLLYLIADVSFLTSSASVVTVLQLAILVAFPYTLWVLVELLDTDFLTLPRKEKFAAAAAVVFIGLAGAYIGAESDRFLVCSDFERNGDFVPQNCVE